MKIFRSAFFIIMITSIFSTENISSQAVFNKSYYYSNLTAGTTITSLESKLELLDSIIPPKSPDKIIFKMKKSPWRAVAYSAILPGAGQFYNESYWKIPVIAGLGGYFVYELIKNNNQYLDYKEQYSNSQTPQNPSGNLQLQSLREFYRDQRDNFIIYSIILYVINLIDAYVDAQLYDFNVSDKIKFGVLNKKTLFKLTYDF